MNYNSDFGFWSNFFKNMNKNEENPQSLDAEESGPEPERETADTPEEERAEVEASLAEAEHALAELSSELQLTVQEIFNVEGDVALQTLQQSVNASCREHEKSWA